MQRRIAVCEAVARLQPQARELANQVPGPRRSRHAGVHALEVYTPRHCARAAELEAAHGVAGKYTEGLLMREWAACDEDEDVASMALTAVRRLVAGRGVRWE